MDWRSQLQGTSNFLYGQAIATSNGSVITTPNDQATSFQAPHSLAYTTTSLASSVFQKTKGTGSWIEPYFSYLHGNASVIYLRSQKFLEFRRLTLVASM